MKNRKSISVWLILQDGENKGKIALQKRIRKQSFPFICQATWAGKVELNEGVDEAMKRECAEELGKEFFGNFNFSSLKLLAKNSFSIKKAEWISYNYVGATSNIILEKAKIHKEAFPEFIFVGKNDKFYSAEKNKYPKDNVVLFDDQYKILKEILNGIKRNNK